MAVDWLRAPPDLRLIRAWAICLLGIFAIVFGLLNHNPTEFMLGFTVLGAEPMSRSVEAPK